MNPAGEVFLYLPVPYWVAFVLLLYRQDLSRLAHPVKDQSGLRSWSFVLSHLKLQGAGARRPSRKDEMFPYAICILISAGLSLSWTLGIFPPVWYYLIAVQGISAVVLTAATERYLGTPPRRPYVDVLRFPRLGSRIRHLPKVPPVKRQPVRQAAMEKRSVRFFSASLRNGVVMSTPSYPEKQVFCSHLIRAIEVANPDFAWIQFLFVKSSYGPELVRLKNSMHKAKASIEQPALDLVSGQEHDKRELHGDYYRKADARMKKVDDIMSKPTITLAIQACGWPARIRCR